MTGEGHADRDPFEPSDEPADPAPQRPASASDFPGKALFAARSPREILRRLLDGDPLEIGARAAERLRQRALLLEHESLVLRTIARTALAGFTYAGTPPMDEWLTARVDEGIADLLGEDEEAEHGGLPPSEPFEDRLRFISEVTGLSPTRARRACVRFNGLPDSARLAFFEVVVEEKRFNRYVAEGHGPPAKLREELMAAFEALSLPLDTDFGADGYGSGDEE
jgi:hypothetical protein